MRRRQFSKRGEAGEKEHLGDPHSIGVSKPGPPQCRRLGEAVSVFLERGYADSTIDDIVAAASIGRATFYLHFKNKLEVMRALIRALEKQNEDLVEELRSYDMPTKELLESWLRRFVERWFDDGDRFLVSL